MRLLLKSQFPGDNYFKNAGKISYMFYLLFICLATFVATPVRSLPYPKLVTICRGNEKVCEWNYYQIIPASVESTISFYGP